MQNRIEAIKERMASLADEVLIKIVTEDINDYEAEAIQIAKDELDRRSIDIDAIENKKHFQHIIKCTNISMSDLVPFNDLIHRADYSLVEDALLKFYPYESEFFEEYKTLYNKLLQLKPAKNDYILITVENKTLDKTDLPINTWDVSGINTESGDKLNLELFSWNNWLSFYVDSGDLHKVGLEGYIAHCLYAMTVNGFNDDDIKRNIEIKSEETNYNRFLYDINKSDSFDVNSDNVLKAAREFKLKIVSSEVPQIRPWVRFWARTLDSFILLFMFEIIKFLIRLKWNMQISGDVIIPILIVFIESALLSTLGTTPGKWLLRIKVRTFDGNKLSYKQSLFRCSMVWILGEAANLNNILSTFTFLVAYFRLTNLGSTYWDEKGQFSITHERIGLLRSIVSVVLVFVFTFLTAEIISKL